MTYLEVWRSGTSFCFTRPSPTLVLQVKNAGVRRPGYEANIANLQGDCMGLVMNAVNTPNSVASVKEVCLEFNDVNPQIHPPLHGK